MRGRHKAALSISLLLHAAIVAPFFLREPKGSKAEISPTEPVTIELKEKIPQGSPQSKSTIRSRIAKGVGSLTGDRLRPKLGVPSRAETAVVGDLKEGSAEYAQAFARDSSARGTSEWLPEHWGYGGGDLNYIGKYLKYEALAREINGILTYPQILARRQYSGTILARMKFTDASACDWSRIEIKRGQQYLRIYVLTVLKKVCELSVIQSLHADRSSVIDLAFAFELTAAQPAEGKAQKENFIVGNVLSFHREEQKLLEYHIGPLRGYWFVPYMDLDIPLIVEKWNQYVNGVDPLAPFKD